MAKLKQIIKQLSPNEYTGIYDMLVNSNSDKSAHLLKNLRERQMSDAKLMEVLDVNTNAYYTLRSRLSQKIEEFLLQQMENPRTDLLKKVNNISEIIFTKKRAIAVATLKKLEKELQDYDLSNELTIVYKALKKLHINHPEHFTYSQNYNRHVAYTLAIDKAEDMLAEYFRKYGQYFLSGSAIDRMSLDILNSEMANVVNLHKSGHRLYVYYSCMNVFHRIMVEKQDAEGDEHEPIEDVLSNVDRLFETYFKDSIYHNLQVVFDYLWMEYYNMLRVYRKADSNYQTINQQLGHFLSNYSLYIFPAQFLLSKVDRAVRNGQEISLYEETKENFTDFESDVNDVPKHLTYVTYRALTCHYAGKYDEAQKWLNGFINEVSLKKYPTAQMELNLFLALEYCITGDFDLFNQKVNSIQRQLRMQESDQTDHIQLYIKMMKVALGENRKTKEEKIKQIIEKINQVNIPHFSPIRHIRMDDKFIATLV